jgi:phage N-6-adenine-methyltransferase
VWRFVVTTEAWTHEVNAPTKQDWGTPQYVFDFFDRTYQFQLDAAAREDNALCKRFIGPETDALSVPWDAQTVWLNPPYGRGVGKWMEKAYREAQAGKTVGVLIFARTDTRWWHDYVMKAKLVFLIRGRLKFLGDTGQPKNPATAPSCFVVFGRYPPPDGPRFLSLDFDCV